MKRSHQKLSINKIIDKDIFENNQITLFPYLTFIPNTGMGIGVNFY